MSITEPMRLRETDDTTSLRVSRTVPSWALFTGGIAFVAQFVALQFGQTRQEERIQELGKKITEQSVSIKEFSVRVDGIAEKAQDVRFKTANSEFRLEDLERRVNTLENGRKRP